MKPIHQVLFAAGLLLLGAITWRVLTHAKPEAGWLTVEAPARVTPGETITLRVTLSQPDPGLRLVADLHGWGRRNHALGAISHANPHPVTTSAPTMDFSLPVSVVPDLTTVRAIIYLSPTGGWHDHVRAATSEEIPVEAASGPAPTRTLHALSVHDQIPEPVIPRLESAGLRRVILGLWLGVAGVLTLRQVRTRRASPPARPSHAPLIGACLAAALAELFHAEQFVGDTARNFAIGHGLYEERYVPQQVAVLLTVVGVVALAVLILIRARQRRIVLGLLVYTALSLVAALSLHETDAVFYATVLGQPVEQVAKLIAVGLSLWGLRSQSQASAVA